MTLHCVWRHDYRVVRWLAAIAGIAYAVVRIGAAR